MDISKVPDTDDLDVTETWYEAREIALRDLVGEIKRIFVHTEDNRPSEYIEAVRLAYWLLNIASEGDDVPEYHSEAKLNGIALGQVIMEHVDPDFGVNKRLWFDVAEHMGPDFGQGMYQAAVFVTKVA